jgi:hypothetical protein
MTSIEGQDVDIRIRVNEGGEVAIESWEHDVWSSTYGTTLLRRLADLFWLLGMNDWAGRSISWVARAKRQRQ